MQYVSWGINPLRSSFPVSPHNDSLLIQMELGQVSSNIIWSCQSLLGRTDPAGHFSAKFSTHSLGCILSVRLDYSVNHPIDRVSNHHSYTARSWIEHSDEPLNHLPGLSRISPAVCQEFYLNVGRSCYRITTHCLVISD